MVTSVSSGIANSLGIGGGIDTASLIEQLTAASRGPKDAILKAKEELNTAQISAVGQASSAISGFSTALTQLISGGTLFTQPTVSDSNVLGASALPGARIGSLSTQIEVMQLAQSQSLVSENLADVSAPVGKGVITLTTKNGDFAVTVDDSNNNLIGLARAINLKGAGVTASIVEDTAGARLVLKGGSGAEQWFTLAVDPGAEPDLLRFAYDPNISGGMTRAQEPQDALLKLDGVSVSRSSNTISDLIEGVKIDLKAANPGTTIALGASRPTAAIKQAVTDVVDTYNALKETLDELTKAASGSSAAGPLRSDTGVRMLRQQLSRLTATVLASGGSYSTLAEIGVATQRDGSLTVDAARLDAAIANDPDSVEALFNPGQTSDSPLVKITSAYGRTKPGTYTVSNLVPGDINTPASGMIDGKAAIGAAGRLVAAISSGAAGLVIEPQAAVASATVTIDLGLGGALKAISDMLTSSTGPFSSSSSRLKKQASDLADDRVKMESREDKYHDQLVRQFSVMSSRVAAIKATQSYIEQQVAMWTKSDN
ncbi:MAG: flagellar filament capping protein FliD [Sphingomonadaceae bacterium]